MLKRYTSLFFLLLAYMVMLGHNLVPHYHHDAQLAIALQEHDEHGDHHHDHYHAGQQEDSNQHADHQGESQTDFPEQSHHDFAHNVHESQVYITSGDNADRDPLPTLDVCCLAPSLQTSDSSLAFRFDKPPSEPKTYLSPHALCSGLRAPPYLMV